MPRPKKENRHGELLYEGTITRDELAWLVFGDPQVMYIEAAGYRDEMGLKTTGRTGAVEKLVVRYRKHNHHVIKMLMDYMSRRHPHLPSELSQDKNDRKEAILRDSLSVKPLMFYYGGMTFAIRDDGTAAVRGADQPNEMHVAPDTERNQGTEVAVARAQADLQVVADSLLLRVLFDRVRYLVKATSVKLRRRMGITRCVTKDWIGMESVNADLRARDQAADGLYRRYVVDIEALPPQGGAK